MKRSFDQIMKVLEKHNKKWLTHTGQFLGSAYLVDLANDLDDLLIEAFREGQKDPDWDR